MVYVVPVNYTARRAFRANGNSYPKGYTFVESELEGLNLSVLVSSGRLQAVPDVHHRRAADTTAARQPTYIHPDAYKAAITP